MGQYDHLVAMMHAQSKAHLDAGLKGFPNDRGECECYPECRIDCDEHEKCYDKMPEYWSREYKAKKYAEEVRARKPDSIGARIALRALIPIRPGGRFHSEDRYWHSERRVWMRPYTTEPVA